MNIKMPKIISDLFPSANLMYDESKKNLEGIVSYKREELVV